MHHPTDRIEHTMAFVTPVVEHWLEREIAQWVHPMKDRSDYSSHHERTLLPRSYISLLGVSGLCCCSVCFWFFVFVFGFLCVFYGGVFGFVFLNLYKCYILLTNSCCSWRQKLKNISSSSYVELFYG